MNYRSILSINNSTLLISDCRSQPPGRARPRGPREAPHNHASARPSAAELALDLGPAVAQRDGAVVDRRVGTRIWVHDEITEPLELHGRPGFCAVAACGGLTGSCA